MAAAIATDPAVGTVLGASEQYEHEGSTFSGTTGLGGPDDAAPIYEILARLPLSGVSEPLQEIDTGFALAGRAAVGRPIITRPGTGVLPLLAAGRMDAPDWDYLHVTFPFDLAASAPGLLYVEAQFNVLINDQAAVAVWLDEIPLPGSGSAVSQAGIGSAVGRAAADLPPRPGEDLAVLGLGGAAFRWRWRSAGQPGGPGDTSLAGGSRLARVLLGVPAGRDELGGLIEVSAVLADEARPTEKVTVGLRTPYAWRQGFPTPAASLRGAASQQSAGFVPADTTARLCVAVDLAGHSKLSQAEQKRTMGVLVWVIDAALAVTLGGDQGVDRQEMGDGILILLPSAIRARRVARLFLPTLAAALTSENAPVAEDFKVRMRIGMDIGTVERGVSGWIGDGIVGAFRLCDSAAARNALPGSQADYVVAASDSLYADVLAPALETVPGWGFTAMVAEVPGKYSEPGWLHVHGADTTH